MDDLAEISTSAPGDTSTDQSGSAIPGYLITSLIFQITMTVVILPMAGWVFATIKTTRSLHKPHNVFVANLMVVDIVLAIFQTSLSVHKVTGLNLLSCDVKKFLFFPVPVIQF